MKTTERLLSAATRIVAVAKTVAASAPRPVVILASGMVATVVVGGVVQVFAPERAPLIVLADSGFSAAESQMPGDSFRFAEADYRAGAELSDKPGEGVVYEMVLGGTPEDRVSELGRYFGVEGEPRPSEYFDPQWPGYVVGPEDWSGPSVVLSWNGSGTWYYSNPDAYPESICEEVSATESVEGVTGIECRTPDPVGPLPSPEEAKAEAAEAFRAGGFVVSTDAIEVLVDDEWGIGVSATTPVGGSATALEWSMYWAPGPILASASGHAATAVSRGTYDTISPVAALERMSSGRWWGAPPLDYDNLYPEEFYADGVPYDAPVEQDSGEPLRVEVGSSTPTLLLVWDALGGAWLVPGYLMRFGEQEWESSVVIAVGDGVIQIQEVMLIDSMVVPEVRAGVTRW